MVGAVGPYFLFHSACSGQSQLNTKRAIASKPQHLVLISVGLIPRLSECRAVPTRTCIGPQVGCVASQGQPMCGAAGALIGKGGGAQIAGQVTYMPVCAMVHLGIAVLCFGAAVVDNTPWPRGACTWECQVLALHAMRARRASFEGWPLIWPVVG